MTLRRTALSMAIVRAAAISAVLLHIMILTITLAAVARGEALGDWVSFYAAGNIVRQGAAEHLFDQAAQLDMQRQLFGENAVLNNYPLPAFFATAISPLTALSFRASYFIWLALNVCLLAGLLALGARAMTDIPPGTKRLLLVAAAASLPVMTVLILGQVDLLVVAAFMGCYARRLRDQRLAAGLVLALAMVKPHLALAPVLMLLVFREWRVLAGFAVSSAGLLLVPAFIFGPETVLDQLDIIRGASSATSEGRVNADVMVNVRGAVVSVTGSDRIWLWAVPTAVIALGGLVAAVRAWSSSGVLNPRAWAIACVLPLLWSPHLHAQSLVLLVCGACLYLWALARGGRAPVAVDDWILGGFATLTFLWLAGLAGVSLLFIPVLLFFGQVVSDRMVVKPMAQEQVADISPALRPRRPAA